MNKITDVCLVYRFVGSEHWPQRHHRLWIRCLWGSGAMAKGTRGYTDVTCSIHKNSVQQNGPKFLEFCSEHSWNPSWPVPMDAVMHFAVYLYDTGLLAATITDGLVQFLLPQRLLVFLFLAMTF